MGNTFAYLALVAWPLVAVYLYQHKSIQVATLWTIIGAYMLLPVKTIIELPGLPDIGKHSINTVAALLGCMLIKKQYISFFKGLGIIKCFIILFVVVPFISASLNEDVVLTGMTAIKGLSYYDGLSAVAEEFLLIAPFFIGRQLFRTYDDQLLMFKILVIAGLFYSLPILFEIRMSPQLHAWIYGYFPHSDFAQQMRQGGFRAVVFMGHGLLVAFFVAVVLISALVLWENRIKIRNLSPAMVSYYTLIVLILQKSVGSIAYGVSALLLIKGAKPKIQHQIAIVIAMVAFFYPILSIMDVFPHQALVNYVNSYSPKRADSLEFRFDNEKRLLNRAQERLWFGWGGWGRNRVYNIYSGKDESTTDGWWIIEVGTKGLLGYSAEFGLILFTVFRAYSASKFLNSKDEQRLLAAHALLLGFIMTDQIPNSSLMPWLYLLVGILCGRSEDIVLKSRVKAIDLELKNFKKLRFQKNQAITDREMVDL